MILLNMLSQSREFHAFDANYSLSFAYPKEDEQNGNELEVDLEVDFSNCDEHISEILIKPRDGHAVNPSIIEIDDSGEWNGKLRILTETIEENFGFIITPWLPRDNTDEEYMYDQHIRLPSIRKFNQLIKTAKEGITKENWQNLESMYDNTNPYFLLDFTSDVRRVLQYEAYVEILSEVAGASGEIKTQLSRTRHDFLKNLIIGDSGGSLHKIEDMQDLKEKKKIYDSQDNLEEINIEYSISNCLEELEDEEEFVEIANIIQRLSLVQEYPDLLENHHVELYASYLQFENEELPRHLINELSSTTPAVDYNETLKEAKRAKGGLKETANLWQKLIQPAYNDPRKNLNFVLGRYLHWKARTYTDTDIHTGLPQYLYKAAASFSKESGDKKFHQLSKNNEFFRRGLEYLYTSRYDSAREAFDEALKVASNRSGEWYEQISNSMLSAIQYKTIAEISGDSVEYDSDDENTSIDITDIESQTVKNKISLLNERVELIKSSFSDTHNQADDVIDRLNVEKFKLLADHRISNDRYELALEAIEEIIKIYSELNKDYERNYHIGRRNYIKAVLHEKKANFLDAANKYEKIQENNSYVTSNQQGRFISLRAKTCRTKSHLLEGNVLAASDLIEEIRADTKELRYEAADLAVLIDAIEDYENSNITQIDKALDRLTDSQDEMSFSYFNVTFNYKPALVAVLAAQRYSKSGINDELIEKFIQVGIAESFTPVSSEAMVSEMGLSEIEPATVWRHNLPIYTHRNLERLEIKENSATTADYSDITSKMYSTFEKYLEFIVEYLAKTQSNNWRSLISDNKNKDLSLGDLGSFFQGNDLSDTPIDNIEKIEKSFDHDIIRGKQLVKIRNDISHGHIDKISKEEYETIKQTIINIFEVTGKNAPILLEPTTKNEFGTTQIYSCELYWSRTQKQVSIETHADLQVGKVYFANPSLQSKLQNRDVVPVRDNKFKICEEERVLEAINKS